MEVNKIWSKINEVKEKHYDLDDKIKEMDIMSRYQGEDELVSSTELLGEIKLDSKREVLRIYTGIPSLDNMIGGFREGQVVVVSGPTGMGKTSLCQTLTENFSSKGTKCLWFSFEVGPEEFLSKFCEMPLFYIPRQLKQNRLDWLEQRIVESIAKYDCKAIFVDHLHFLLEMQKMAEAKSISLLIGMMMRELKRMAIKYEVCIFLVSHLRKTIFDKMPDIDDLRDSSFVGQESDIVMFIKRVKDGDTMTNQATLKVAKNRRNGNLGLLKLIYKDNKFNEVSNLYENDNSQPSDHPYFN